MSPKVRTYSPPVVAPPPPAETIPALPWLTVERAGFALLALLALLLRLPGLAARPLAPAEAASALRAWQASQGLHPILDAGSPLLFSLQTLFFWLVGDGGDALARIGPLLAAAALPLILYRWRQWLDSRILLVAACLLTLSPLVNAFARRGDGFTFTLLALALALDGWQQGRAGERAGWNRVAAGLALLLISGPAGPTALFSLLLFLFVTRAARPMPAGREIQGFAGPALLFLGLLLAGGAAFLTRIDALGLAALDWSQWLAAWRASPRDWLWGLLRLFLDEPLIMGLGLAGAVWYGSRSRLLRALAAAGLLAAGMAILQGMDASFSRGVAAFWLAPPAAAFLLALARGLAARRQEYEGWLLAAALLGFAGAGMIALLRFTYDGDVRVLALPLIIFLVGLLIILLFAYLLGRKTTLIFAAAALALLLFLSNQAALAALAYDAAPPRFPGLYAVEGRAGVRDLAQTLGDISERRLGERWAFPIAYIPGGVVDDQVLWYLRRAPDLRVVTGVGLDTAPPLVVAPAGRELALSERYAGSEFAAAAAWSPAGDADLPAKALAAWLLLRRGPWELPTTHVILWADAAILSPE